MPTFDEIKEFTQKAIRFFKHKTADMGEDERIVFIYNRSMDDAADALRVFADRNPQQRSALSAAASKLEQDFRLRLLDTETLTTP